MEDRRSASRLSFTASLCALVAVGLQVPALAGAWTAPVTLSAGGEDSSGAQVAVDADGDAVFTWVRSDGTNDRIQARARSAAGVLSPVQTLSGPGRDASDPQVAVDADGDAVFTWLRFDGVTFRVQARARSAAGVLSAVQDLSDNTGSGVQPQVAVDTDGDAVFTWSHFDGTHFRIQGRARSAAGVLSPVQTLSAAGQTAFGHQVAVDATGDAVFAWHRFDGTAQRIQARARSAAGALGPVQTLSGAGQTASSPQLDLDPDGDAVITWVRFDGTDNRIQALARSAAGVLSPVQTLSAAGEDAFEHQVAVDATGDAVFTWSRFIGTHTRVQTRARSAAGVLSAVQTLSDPGANASGPQVGVDTDGDAVFAWRRPDVGANFRVQGRARSAAGILGAVQTLSSAGQSASSPDLGVDADGDAIATWSRSDGTNERVQASAGP